MSTSRPLRRPLPGFAGSDLPVTPYPARDLWRLHEKGREAIYFSLNPEHRFSHADCPCKVLYLGEGVTTCIWERFGDDVLNPGSPVSLGLWASRSLSRVAVPDLKLCDLTDETTAGRAKVDLSALTFTDLAVPQEWGLRIQQHPLAYDGLRYLSRFDKKPCIALFERPGIAARLRETLLGDLADSPEGDAFLTQHEIALI
jgi:hypothetical protein